MPFPSFSARHLVCTLLALAALASTGCGGVSGETPDDPNLPAPTATLAANPASVASGATATLTWSTTNASSISIDNGIGAVAASGQRSVTPAATTTYTLTASGNGKTVTAQTTVTVASTPAPTVTSFTASPATIAPGESAKLIWSTSNANTVSIDNGVGSQPASGEVTVTPSATTTYTLVANGAGGQSVPATATVTIGTANDLSRINHILFMVQENRSFDQYFGKLDEYRVREFGLPPGAIDGIPANASNPLFAIAQDGTRTKVGDLKPFHLRTGCVDNTSPTWNEAFTQRNLEHPNCQPGVCKPLDPVPPMDGFTFTGLGYAYNNIEWDIKGRRSMGYYTDADLPYYYYMATQFATSNRFFSPVLTRTQPNLLYAYAATSAGYIYPPAPNDPKLPQPTIFDRLEAAGISWKVYDPTPDNVPVLGIFPVYSKFVGTKIVPMDQYFDDLEHGTLPAVAFILSSGEGLDEHPGGDLANRTPDPKSPNINDRCAWLPPDVVDPALPDNDPKKYDITTWDSGKTKPALNCGIHIQYGAQYVAGIIKALMQSSAWKDSVFIWTFDESGGIYDHVPPRPAVPPDDIAPRYRKDETGKITDTLGGFHITGGRVPFFLVSPFAKKHYVSDTVMDYTAVLKLIEDRYSLQPLTRRDAAQPSMVEFFDFVNPPWTTPPTPPEQTITLPCDRTRLN